MTLRPSAFYGAACTRLHTLRRAWLRLAILTTAALTVAILSMAARAVALLPIAALTAAILTRCGGRANLRRARLHLA